MKVLIALALAGSFVLGGRAKEEATVSPDASAAAATPESAPEPTPGISPELVATYEGMVRNVYSRDAERCLENQMEAEDSKYMRTKFTLTITVAEDGTTQDVVADSLAIQVRNYDGDVLREGDVKAMTDCLLDAARGWEYEPLPPTPTTFGVVGSVGD